MNNTEYTLNILVLTFIVVDNLFERMFKEPKRYKNLIFAAEFTLLAFMLKPAAVLSNPNFEIIYYIASVFIGVTLVIIADHIREVNVFNVDTEPMNLKGLNATYRKLKEGKEVNREDMELLMELKKADFLVGKKRFVRDELLKKLYTMMETQKPCPYAYIEECVNERFLPHLTTKMESNEVIKVKLLKRPKR